MKALWLASWYPNKYEPVNGDFIQRHAQAVKSFVPVDVIHVVQLGKDADQKSFFSENTVDDLREFIYGFEFNKWNIGFIDKIRYNISYLRFYKKILQDYRKKHGQPDIIHVHVPIKAGIVARYISEKWNVPYLVSEQASYYERSAPDNFYKRSKFFKKNAARIFRDAAFVTNVSATIGEVIKQMFGLKKVATIHNLVDTNTFHYRNFKRGSEFVWLHVSALGEQKNIAGMLKAFSHLNASDKNWRLRMVGPDTKKHHQLVKDFGLEDKVEFTGEIPHNSVAGQMQNANGFVLFSRHENFPCVVVEALCCGLPVVASNVGGIKEAITAFNGILVQPGDVMDLADKMQTVMDNYHNYNPLQIGSEAAGRYDAKIIAQQFVDLYRTILNS